MPHETSAEDVFHAYRDAPRRLGAPRREARALLARARIWLSRGHAMTSLLHARHDTRSCHTMLRFAAGRWGIRRTRFDKRSDARSARARQ